MITVLILFLTLLMMLLSISTTSLLRNKTITVNVFNQACENGYVQIHSNFESANDKFCGGYLGEASEEANAGAVQGKIHDL